MSSDDSKRQEDEKNTEDPRKSERDETPQADIGFEVTGLGAIGTMISRLNDLLEAVDDEFSGERDIRDKDNKVRGRMGWTVRTLGDTPPSAARPPSRSSAPRRPQPPREKPPQPAPREPIAEVYDEDDVLLVIVELPGVGTDEIDLDLQGETLVLRTTGQRQYAVDVELPHAAQTIAAQSMNNGILEVRLR